MTLPANMEAETAVLGAILTDPTSLDRVVDLLAPEAFYDGRNAAVYGTCLALSGRGEPVDLVTVAAELQKRDFPGGAPASYASDLSDKCATSANIRHYAKLVADAATLRRMIRTCDEIREKAAGNPRDVTAFVDEAERLFFSVAQTKADKAVRLGDHVTEFYRELETMKERGSALTGLSSGLADVDQMTGGFHPSDLVILAARPGHGKSAMALNIAEYVTIHAQTCGVLYFSLEMSKSQLERRLFSGLSGVDLWRINRGCLYATDFTKIAHAGQRISGAELWVDDSAALTPAEVRGRARRLARQKGVNLGLVIVDYLQLMRVPGSRSREQEIAEVSRALKQLAKELQVPVLALAQLNREVEQRNPPIPRLSDLRDSGQIEQDADLILFLYRADTYREDRTKHDGRAMLIVGKQRNGPTGAVTLHYQAERTRFVNAEREAA